VRLLDLLPVFQAEADPLKLYFQNDYHLTAAGHQLSAKAITLVLGKL
jgi:lysophospholipase L1-like esterase